MLLAFLGGSSPLDGEPGPVVSPKPTKIAAFTRDQLKSSLGSALGAAIWQYGSGPCTDARAQMIHNFPRYRMGIAASITFPSTNPTR